MLCVNQSPLAPRRIYRALRSGKTRYDTELEKGWAEHVERTAPIQSVEVPSPTSRTGRIITASGDRLDDVDVSLPTIKSTILEKLLKLYRSSYLRQGICSGLNSVAIRMRRSTKSHCLDIHLRLQALLDLRVT